MSGEKVLREAVSDHRREMLALQDRHASLAAEYANAKAAWEAEVAALRAERDADRDAFLADIGRRARVYDAIEEGLLAALATERARAMEEAGGFEGHPPGVCLEHGRFRLEGAGLIDTEGPLSLCTGCGKLSPHAGCQAICAACAPPNGTCYCAGCQVAGKASPPPASAAPGEERCPEPRWFPESDPPINPGWYAVQRKDGSLCLRAFGNDEWWIPLKDGWLSGLPPGFRWLGPLEPVEWDTPGRAPRAEEGT